MSGDHQTILFREQFFCQHSTPILEESWRHYGESNIVGTSIFIAHFAKIKWFTTNLLIIGGIVFFCQLSIIQTGLSTSEILMRISNSRRAKIRVFLY